MQRKTNARESKVIDAVGDGDRKTEIRLCSEREKRKRKRIIH